MLGDNIFLWFFPIYPSLEGDGLFFEVKDELKNRKIEFIETDTSGFKKAIQDNIEEILGGNKDAIDVYWKIIKKQY